MDTIVTFSTGSLPSAIGIVRLSGDYAHEVFSKIFLQKNRRLYQDGQLRYGSAVGRDGEAVDLCLATVFGAPNSYTGENMAEIYCHGSQAVVDELLKAAQKHGARLAQAGEFTRRSFLNGKLDLTRAEAVGDLIHAQSLNQAKAAVGQIKGRVFHEIDGIYQEITYLLAHFYAVCDYSDEDIEPWEYENAQGVLQNAHDKAYKLWSTFERGQVIKNGLATAIIGKPNVGKSSLLNALLGYDRAIVTAEAGTTRDTVEEAIQIKGSLFRLIDTAGVRNADNLAEKMGIERSKQAMESAGLVICVFDGSLPLDHEDFTVIDMAKTCQNVVFIVNKCDLIGCDSNIYSLLPENAVIFEMSALCKQGVDKLTQYMENLVVAPSNESLITNARQAGLLQQACSSFAQAIESAKIGMTADAFLMDCEQGLGFLGEIIGKTVNTDVVNEIFSKFCVGK